MTVLHAFSVPFEARLNLAGVAQDDIDRYRLDARHEAVRHVDSILRDVDIGDRLVRRSIEPGEAPRLILRREKELGADLIVIGKHGDSLLDVMFLGSVTRHIIGGSKCDVLVVGEEAEQQTLT
jgi:nucleotide-binding universal stress UspA family protein